MNHAHNSPVTRGVSLVVMAAAALQASAQQATESAGEAVGPMISEVVVTASRREERLSDVPLSISAFTEETMQALGVKGIEDIEAFTPGLTLQGTSTSGTTISIRGIRSQNVGSATTGIYIDDTPIQVRAVGYTAENSYPMLFDLERVEVLRGPQGTLFGAGSQGGTVRFITARPNMRELEGHALAESSFSDEGDPSYEVGLAVGGPIVEDKLGFRASGWYRKSGGYIDWVNRTTGAPRGEDVNWEEYKSGRVAFGFTPSERLTITPSVFVQETYRYHVPLYWESFSDPDEGDFVTATSVRMPRRDRFVLPSLSVDYEFDSVQLISATSYFDRDEEKSNDFSYLFTSAFQGGNPFLAAFPDYAVESQYTNKQENFTQELRLQSVEDGGRFDWTAGVFYSDAQQLSTQHMYDPDLNNLTQSVFGRTPEQVFGVGLFEGLYSVYFLNETSEQQLAGFGEVSYGLTDRLKLTVGVRASQAKFDFEFLGEGPYNAGHSVSSGSSEETPVTQKVSLSYQLDQDQMWYATASKGYRIGGANTQISEVLCGQDLANFGLTTIPTTYDSDYLWNYELGTKSKFFGNRLQVDASVFYINWEDIQQRIQFPICAFNFITNLNEANSKGFDLYAAAQVTNNLLVTMAVGYTDAAYTEDTFGGANPATGQRAVLFADGDPLGVPSWSVSTGIRYDFPFLSRHDGFVRADYAYTAGYKVGAGPRSVSHDPFLRGIDERNLVKLRAAVTLDQLELAAFIDNALNESPAMGRARLGNRGTAFTNVSAQPRSYGMSVSYRF
jgi:iron complex outermembrane receptor protein